MVHRTKDLTKPPALLMDTKWDLTKADALTSRHLHKVNSSCYRDCTIEALMELYKNKCAICERKYGTELEVDHYRPKKPRTNITGVEYNQPGYYWLPYEWENLMPLCSRCNQLKSNKFPLAGWTEVNRITNHTNPGLLVPFNCISTAWLNGHENPLMINPEIELLPERHFIFKRDGTVSGRTDEGKETIKICGLNRKDLKRERLKIREDIVNQIKSAFDDFAISKDVSELRGEIKAIFKILFDGCHKDSAHSLYHTYLFKYFDYFIDAKMPASLRGKATTYFKAYRNLKGI